MQTKSSGPPLPSTRSDSSPNPLLNLMLDRFWRDTRSYLNLAAAENPSKPNEGERKAA